MLWQINFGGFPTTNTEDFSSLPYIPFNKFFIPCSIKLNIGDKPDYLLVGKLYVKDAWFPNGDCSSMAECTTVARETRVRFPPFALPELLEDYRSKKIDELIKSLIKFT